MTVKARNTHAFHRNFLNIHTLLIEKYKWVTDLWKNNKQLHASPSLNFLIAPESPLGLGQCPSEVQAPPAPTHVQPFCSAIVHPHLLESVSFQNQFPTPCAPSVLLLGFFHSPTLCEIAGRGPLTMSGLAGNLHCPTRTSLVKCWWHCFSLSHIVFCHKTEETRWVK